MRDTEPKLTVKEQYDECKMLECPRLLRIASENEKGNKYIAEGDLAYRAIVLCNHWYMGLSDGTCPVKPIDGEEGYEEPVGTV